MSNILLKLRALVRPRASNPVRTILIAGVVFAVNNPVLADIPGRALPAGAVPNPGTQQRELANITLGAAYNVFEFVVTCAGCHGGSVDQHTGHFSNWAGTSMASSARDPVFRANQIGVNSVVKSITGQDGAGNVCMRCHSPNGWLSGRFDPALGGKADASNMIQSILLSTDTEGVMCETCHRAVGSVSYKRDDIVATTGLDSVWNLLAGLFDWQHEGREMTDQAGDTTIAANLPYGDTSLQFLDGMTYIGPYSGTGDIYFSDLPVEGSYTGQIYAVYPDWWTGPKNPAPVGMPAFNSAGKELAYAPDGTLPPIFEVPIGVPTVGGNPDYTLQSLSLEHPTTGSGGRIGTQVTGGSALPALPAGMNGQASPNEYIRTSEFCGSCHDLTVPILGHGMPEQRTYSEWKFSAYSQASNVINDPLGKRTGTGVERCQDCHMPKLKHEFSDDWPDSLNGDPLLTGGFPYGKNRDSQGGTAMHKLTGANRDLPMMMKALYPEIDLEVVGTPTGKDPRVFPGMLSDRGPMYDRAQRNTEITLRDAVDAQIIRPPKQVKTLANGDGVFRMVVRVHNNSGHRIPSGYPDGRRFWLSVDVKDQFGTSLYKSGVYDQVNAELMTDETTPFVRAQHDVINAVNPANNAVMVYERVTGTCTDAGGNAIFPDPTAGTPVACTPSPALTNNFILFDNRIPPKGLDYVAAREAGVKFWNYDPATGVPYEDDGDATHGDINTVSRYSAGELRNGFDQVVYRWRVPAARLAEVDFSLTGAVEVYWQTHTREFMEHLRTQDTSTVRPERTPNPLDPNYPNNPNYLSDSIAGLPLSSYTTLDGLPLNDNWGGIAYAAWLATGKGAPYLVDRDDTAVLAAPAAPANVAVAALDSGDPEYIDPVTLAPDSFAAKITWDPVADADGYMIWIRYGKSDATSDWDRLAVVDNNTTRFVEHVLGHAGVGAKSYGFKVTAFNGKGEGESAPVTYTIADVSIVNAPNNVTASLSIDEGSTDPQISLTWNDTANNEGGFEVWRYGPVSVGGIPTPATQNLVTVLGGPDAQTAIPTQTGGGADPSTGFNTFKDDGLVYGNAPEPDSCYLYQVRAQVSAVNTALGSSIWSAPQATGCTVPGFPVTASASINVVALNWGAVAGAASYRITQTDPAGAVTVLGTTTGTSYADTGVQPMSTYGYTVTAISATNVAFDIGSTTATTPADTVPAPSNVQTVATATDISVSWIDNTDVDDGFVLERSVSGSGLWMQIPGVGGYILNAGPVGSTVTYVDNGGLLQGQVYQYRVKAIRLNNGGESAYAYSGPVSLVSVPVSPSTFSAVLSTTLSANLPQVDLAWNDVANETAYLLERHNGTRCNAARNWRTVETLAADVIQTADASVPARNRDFSYCYRLQASNGAGASARTYVIVDAPARPIQPAAALTPVVDVGGVVMSFELPVGLLGYRIERRANTGAGWGGWLPVSMTIGTGGLYSYTDTDVVDRVRYRFRIRHAIY
ncbi:MAG: multiheme c-type cytochrome, partial [Candidatus Thiodiazotropha sp.]